MSDGPRLIGRKDAATYLGISTSTFSLWVATNKMPGPIPGTKMWDKKAIDARLDEISGLVSPAADEDPYEKWQRENGRSTSSPSSDYQRWYDAKIKRREKYRPKHNLDAKLERVLRFLADHPDCDTVDLMPGAGPAIMDKLVDASLVRVVSTTGKLYRYEVTEEGRAELHRLKKWKSLTP